VTLGEAVVLSGLAGVEAVVNALFGVFSDLLAAFTTAMSDGGFLDVSFVGLLFEYVTGGKATPLDVISMMLAVSSTLAYKAVFAVAPYTAESLQQLQQVFTVDALLAASGLGGDLAASDLSGFAAFQEIWVVQYTITYFFYLIFEPALDLIPPNVEPPEFLSKTVMGCEISQLVYSIPWSTALHPPWPDLAGWGWNVLSTVIDLIFWVKYQMLPENTGDGGVIWDFGSGFVALVFGIAEIVDDDNVATGIGSISSAVTDIGKLARHTLVVDGTDGLSLLVTATVDLIGNGVVIGLQAAEVEA
jgi:hypothetical protein